MTVLVLALSFVGGVLMTVLGVIIYVLVRVLWAARRSRSDPRDSRGCDETAEDPMTWFRD